MKRLVINIGGEMQRDIKEVFEYPSKAKPGTHSLYLKDTEEFHQLLSPKRLELLGYIIKHQSGRKTISELAKKLKRKQEAVSRDANILTKYRIIEKIREKQMIYLKALYNSLEIRLTG
ncbi:MAG: hypothetical protein V1494_06190 [Candidatus Diapherotrites archaeon]